jgi:hypothetical protein
MAVIDSNPFEALEIIKREFLKLTSNDKLYIDSWNNTKFDGKIAKTTKWFSTDNYENFLKNGNKEYEFVDIEYEINEHRFRTSSKTNNKRSKNLIACFGCSHTFGEGLPWNETWPSILNSMMGSEWVVRNYGFSGASNDMIARYIHNYTLENNPKCICVFLPETLRMELYDKNENDFNNFLPTDNDEIKKYNIEKWKYYRAYRDIANEENGMYNFIKNFKFIDMLCNTKNIPWFWCTWAYPVLFSSEELKNKIFNTENYVGDSNVEKYLDVARDGRHFGKRTCARIAESFYVKIKENKL